MKQLLFLISIASLTSCVVLTDISHSYDHYGNDVFMNKRDFYYVKQSAIGTSEIVYEFNNWGQYIGGGNVVSGAIADAKKDLADKYPLKENEAYSNITIDVTETITKQYMKGLFGSISQFGKTLEKKINIVISADIISFGDINEKRLIVDHVDNEPIDTDNKHDVEFDQNSEQETSEPIYVYELYAVGDTVLYKGEVATILSVSPTSVRIQYQKGNGSYAKKWVWYSDIKAIKE